MIKKSFGLETNAPVKPITILAHEKELGCVYSYVE